MSDFKSLIEALCALPSETEYVEFKESYSDFNKEGRDICALSNSAALKNVPRAYKIWGITDNTHEIVGTTFDPRKVKKGNQDLEIHLRTMLSPNLNFEFHNVDLYGTPCRFGDLSRDSLSRTLSKPSIYPIGV